jgi:hypothetical protein
MSSDKLRRLHNTYLSGTYSQKHSNPIVDKMMDEPHLAIFINGDWLPVLPGMIIGLIKNRKHVDGVAPYILKKVETKPGKEFIDLVAWSSDGSSSRKLQFLANYSGVYRSSTNASEERQEAVKDAEEAAGVKR